MKKGITIFVASLVLIALANIKGFATENSVSACYSAKNGAVRIVSDSEECRPSETLISLETCVESPRYFSCPGINFAPSTSDTLYGFIGSLRFDKPGSINPQYSCNAVLPDGVVIKAVRFHVRDFSDAGEVSCKMWRTNLLTPFIFSHQVLIADAGGSGIENTNSEHVLLETDEISEPFVDNNSFAYYVQCVINGGNSADLGIWGASVEYIIPCD